MMVLPGPFLIVSAFIAGFTILTLSWIWLVLFFTRAIACLWYELVDWSGHHGTAARRPPPAVDGLADPGTARASNGSKPLPLDRVGLLSRMLGRLLPAFRKSDRIRTRPRPASYRWNASPRLAEGPLVRQGKSAVTAQDDGVEGTPKVVPLFVIDAPFFQSAADVLDARPASILEILEDVCSDAKAAGHSDEEITRMLVRNCRGHVSVTKDTPD
jgi:hypothetical protein